MAKFFINCDWGTSHFRLRLVAADECTVAAERRSPEGVARLAEQAGRQIRSDQFASALQQGLRQLFGHPGNSMAAAPVLISGMASSSIGWQELPYAQTPWRLDGSDMVWRELEPVESTAGPHRVVLLSGVRTATDVMRGEETQALGVFQLEIARRLADRSIVVMPGTHSKHLRIDAGRIVDFRTFMTGELFDVLSRHSILRHSVAAEVSDPGQGADILTGHLSSFLTGAREAAKGPLSAALFRVRTRQLLDAEPAGANRAFLSGVVIGAELADLVRQEPRDVPVLLCAAEPLAGLYQTAFAGLEATQRLTVVPVADVERLSALGQACVARRLGLI